MQFRGNLEVELKSSNLLGETLTGCVSFEDLGLYFIA